MAGLAAYAPDARSKARHGFIRLSFTSPMPGRWIVGSQGVNHTSTIPDDQTYEPTGTESARHPSPEIIQHHQQTTLNLSRQIYPFLHPQTGSPKQLSCLVNRKMPTLRDMHCAGYLHLLWCPRGS